jgi:opacity protein-like surface antigen
MPIFAVRLSFAFLVVALCLGERPAHAQSTPLTNWTTGWLGFGGDLNAGPGANTDGNFPGFAGADAAGFSSMRYNFSNGWFVGNERGMGMGLSMRGINQTGAFGSLYSEGGQFGYNFKNAPVTVYAGFDTLKYNSGIGSGFSSLVPTSGTVPGYGAHAGVEFKPTSNLSLSLGFGYTQQSGRIDSDTKSPSLSNASQFDLVGGPR